MAEQTDFKSVFDEAYVTEVAQRVQAAYSSFDLAKFKTNIPELTDLPMKQRVRVIASALHQSLPESFSSNINILKAAFAAQPSLKLSEVTGFKLWVVLQYVEDYGLDDFDASMDALYEWTQRFSAEFAIRPFLHAYPEKTLARLNSWVNDKNEHIRRLVSEGSRPRLPWGMRLPLFVKDPTPVFKLLSKLVEDESEYVRRSVANNLNDITKDHPEQVVSWLKGVQQKYPDSKTLPKLMKHACRTLIKKGDPETLSLFGFGAVPELKINHFGVSPSEIQFGQKVMLHCDLTSLSSETQNLVIDYVVHFQKQNDKSAERVLKWGTRSLEKGETISLKKSHAMVPVTVRKYYAGAHKVELQINGQRLASGSFLLLTGSDDL